MKTSTERFSIYMFSFYACDRLFCLIYFAILECFFQDIILLRLKYGTRIMQNRDLR